MVRVTRRALHVHAVADQGEARDRRSSSALRSDDTNHGFRIVGSDANVIIPKRGRGEATLIFRRRHAGPLHLRVLEDVRRRAQLHARADHRRGVEVSDVKRMMALATAVYVVAVLCVAASRARPSARCRAIRCRGSPAASSRSSGSASRTSPRSRRRKRASVRRSTARAAPSATACRRLAAPAWSPRCARRAATSSGEFVELVPTSGSLFQIFSIPDAYLPADHSARGERDLAARADSAVWRGPGRSDSRRDAAGARRCGRSGPRRRQRPGRGHHRYRHRPAPRRTLRMEGAARDAAGVRRRTPTGTRWGSPTICFRTSSRSASRPSR